jgi:glycosyltransferase involved in cell wall biosynthesis
MEPQSHAAAIGVVVIGRNEAQLDACLASVLRGAARVVYVDSGSTDPSVAVARRRGVDVLELDPGRPFNAARARNEGFARLRAHHPECDFVQFVDGDCELADSWLEKAADFLASRPDAATVAGRLREKNPGASIYNALCDIEWDVPPGESQACGGVFMVRAKAFEKAGGFREDLLAGEEPELTRRLAEQGWRHWRIAGDMAWHDAGLLTFSQWWTRTVRNGYGFGQGFALARPAGERLWARQLRSAWLWAGVIPALGIVGLLVWGLPALAIGFLYPFQIARLALRGTRSRTVNWWSAALLVVGKFAEFAGHIRYLIEWPRAAHER